MAPTISLQQRMDQLIEFEAENGHMFVPFNYKEKNGLGRFVSNTRQHRKTSKIKDDVIAKLDSIGFVWVVPKGPAKDELVAWGKHFRWLKNFWETKGHCNVPANIGGEAVPTAKWCDEQRQLHLHGKLEKGRFERLSRLGFDFFGDGSSDDEQKSSKRQRTEVEAENEALRKENQMLKQQIMELNAKVDFV